MVKKYDENLEEGAVSLGSATQAGIKRLVAESRASRPVPPESPSSLEATHGKNVWFVEKNLRECVGGEHPVLQSVRLVGGKITSDEVATVSPELLEVAQGVNKALTIFYTQENHFPVDGAKFDGELDSVPVTQAFNGEVERASLHGRALADERYELILITEGQGSASMVDVVLDQGRNTLQLSAQSGEGCTWSL